MTHSVLRTDGCDIPLPGGGVSHGVDQDWYGSHWRRTAGCGPSTASNMLRYFSHRLPLPQATGSRGEMTALMERVWDYVTPGVFGLNSAERFRQGMEELLSHLNSPMRCHVLEVHKERAQRPDIRELADFLQAAMAGDSPVGFLNLHNGSLRQLDRWHWVTLLSFSLQGERLIAQAVDNGKRLSLDLSEWMATSALGGGFVYCL